MREKLHHQLPLRPPPVDHDRARELAEMSAILDQHRDVLDLVLRDLTLGGKVRDDTGRPGRTAELVLRAVVIKQMEGFSYEDLTFHLADSRSYRGFCGIGEMDAAPKKSALKRDIKRLTAETLEEVSRLLVVQAKEEGIEKGDKVRFDCMVSETNIHEPTDSSLLWDIVRVLTRIMGRAKEDFGLWFPSRARRAKRRALGISNAKNDKQRKKLYGDLLKVTGETLEHASRVATELKEVEVSDMADIVKAEGMTVELRHYIALGHRVWEQAHRRVIFGEEVPAQEKIVSIFEEHTDIIVKKQRETEFGHKLCVGTGVSNLVLDCRVLDGNPADSTLAVDMVKRQKVIYGKAPRQVAYDGGFSSKANLAQIKNEGVEDVAFSKGRGLEISEMVRSNWVYKRLRNFRAGIEGNLSWLMRCLGLGRCMWRGMASFKAYVWASIVSGNLLTLARHRLKKAV